MALTVDNWSKWALIEPIGKMTCGKPVDQVEGFELGGKTPLRRAITEGEDGAESPGDQTGLVQLVRPGYSEMMLFEKDVSLSRNEACFFSLMLSGKDVS